MLKSSGVHLPKILFLLFTLGFLLSAVACGGSGSGGDSAAGVAASGSVAIVLTDAPTDEFVQVFVTVTRIDLLSENGDGGEGHETIFEGRETFDLLSLENVSTPFAIADDILAGTYSKLRMEVEEIELVRMLADGGFESVFPRLPGGNRIDLNSRGGFRVEPGGTLTIRLDMDARNSIHVNGTGSGEYNFRSQVFVEIMDVERPGRLIFVEGFVREIDHTEGSAEVWLCEIAVSHRDLGGRRDSHCLTVLADQDTSVFDHSGLATDLMAIDVGDRLGVLGRFTHDDEDRFAISADVIELGGAGAFLSLTGVVFGGLDELTGTIHLALDPGQGFVEGLVVEVEVVDETRIFSADGQMADLAEVEVGARLEVDGVLALSLNSPDLIRAAVIFVQADVTNDQLTVGSEQ